MQGNVMDNKQRLQTILDGGVPDVPPHWELVFQLGKERFGMDPKPLRDATYPSQEAKGEALATFEAEMYARCVEELGWAAVPGGYESRKVALTRKIIADKALVAAYEGDGVFWMPSGNDIMDFTVQLYEDFPGLLAKARQKCDKAKEYFAQAVDAGADFFMLTYDFGFNDNPFISPEHFHELCAPFLTECVEKIHSLGKKVILHSDGCLAKILDDIHQSGIDGYQSVDPQGHMDIRDVRAKYPNWILMGNVACNMLQDCNEKQIRESVQYCMQHGGIGKRYIFSTSNCIFSGMPTDSYRIMLDEYHRLIAKVINVSIGLRSSSRTLAEGGLFSASHTIRGPSGVGGPSGVSP